MVVVVRPYTLADFSGLLAVQREAFPPPFPEELWWNKTQISSHVETFPQGAMLAEWNGEIVGSATSLLIKYNANTHNWSQVADNGYIRNSHQPDGDSLYGIDLCVRPAFRKQGIAQALYQARKELVLDLGLKRFLAGARIPGYHRVAYQMSATDYVQQVVQGEIHDQVLTFMLKQGLRPLQVLTNYLEDDESLNYAVLVEWANPHL